MLLHQGVLSRGIRSLEGGASIKPPHTPGMMENPCFLMKNRELLYNNACHTSTYLSSNSTQPSSSTPMVASQNIEENFPTTYIDPLLVWCIFSMVLILVSLPLSHSIVELLLVVSMEQECP
jgi:hypothetical protein